MTPGAGLMTMFWLSSALSAEGSAIRIWRAAVAVPRRATAPKARRCRAAAARRRQAAHPASDQRKQRQTRFNPPDLTPTNFTRDPRRSPDRRTTRIRSLCSCGGRWPNVNAAPAVKLANLAVAAGKDALRIAAEIGDRFLDAVDRAAAVLHQRFDVLQPLPGEPRQIVGDDAEPRVTAHQLEWISLARYGFSSSNSKETPNDVAYHRPFTLGGASLQLIHKCRIENQVP